MYGGSGEGGDNISFYNSGGNEISLYNSGRTSSRFKIVGGTRSRFTIAGGIKIRTLDRTALNANPKMVNVEAETCS
jgi:hypothetical protein